jgi:hypothetical protein
MKLTTFLGLALAASVLTGCGGGGGGGTPAATGPVSSTLAFPLQSAYRVLTANGMSKSFTISGSCSGSGTKTTSPANTATTFEGAFAFSAASTFTLSFTNCTPASIASTSTSYADTNYDPRGFNSVGVNYGVFLTPLVIPTTVIVGGTAVLGTETLYTDSTKVTSNGRNDVSYVVEADTSTTAIINVISKSYNASGTLTSTEQDRYRINATGTLTPTVFDIQYTNGSTIHLVLTF